MFLQHFSVLTVAARQGVTPLMIFLTNNWLLVTQRVPRVTRERHTRVSGEAAATAATVDWDARIEARVRLHFHTCESQRQSQKPNGRHINMFWVIKPKAQYFPGPVNWTYFHI